MMENVNGVDLFYRTDGNGQPLLLLHGNGEDHTIFNELAAKMKDHFTIYAIDSRDHGKSSRTGEISYHAMTEDMFAFITKLDLKKVNIIGFSDGAIVSLMLAMRHPETISRMALLGPNLSPDDFTDESYQFIKETYDETNDPLFKLMLEQPNIKLDEIRNVTIPTLVLGGENDIYKEDTFRNIADAMPNAVLKIMEGHEHDTYIVHQAILYDDLMSFFS